MFFKNKKNYCSPAVKTQKAFTLIEALVFLFIFSVITLTFYNTFSLGSRYIIDAKNRLGAIALANEKMEIIHNLKYENIGTTGGIPSGSIADDEDVTENTRTYHVHTLVQFIDDSFDESFPEDNIPEDYKRVKVTVSWPGPGSVDGEVSLVSRFVPTGLETNSGDGILSVNVIDGTGVGVSQATVHITNSDVSPNVNITTQTDNNGNLIFPGAKESILGYHIAVSKSGYETVETVDPTTVAYIPVDMNASVVAGQLSTKSIVENRISDLTIKSNDQADASLANVSFHLGGGRLLGTDTSVSPSVSVYNLSQDSNTGSGGSKDFNDVSPGTYSVSSISVPDGYSLVGVNSISGYSLSGTDPVYSVNLLPGENKEIKIKFAKNDVASLLIRVVDSGNLPVQDAQVHLTNSSGYDQTLTTLADGVAFFPVAAEAFQAGDYNINIQATGFDEYSGTETVDADTAVSKQIQLTAN